MSQARNAGVAGGVLLLALWGGIGFFFGSGKGKGKGKATDGAVKTATRQTPDVRVVPQPRVRQRKVDTPSKGIAAPTLKESFTYVLRMKFIHPVKPDGSRSDQTISIEKLIEQGRRAQAAKKELLLRIRGDAKAIWLKEIKQKLKAADVAFSVSTDN